MRCWVPFCPIEVDGSWECLDIGRRWSAPYRFCLCVVLFLTQMTGDTYLNTNICRISGSRCLISNKSKKAMRKHRSNLQLLVLMRKDIGWPRYYRIGNVCNDFVLYYVDFHFLLSWRKSWESAGRKTVELCWEFLAKAALSNKTKTKEYKFLLHYSSKLQI